MDTKRCLACHVEKGLEEFPWRNRARGKRGSYCRACARAAIRKHYRARPAYYLEKARKRNQLYRVQTFDKLRAFLLTHPCVDCGEADPVVLEFDHMDGQSKELAISEMVRSQRAWATILKEIGKCQVRCANCHRRRTARQQRWFLWWHQVNAPQSRQ